MGLIHSLSIQRQKELIEQYPSANKNAIKEIFKTALSKT